MCILEVTQNTFYMTKTAMLSFSNYDALVYLLNISELHMIMKWFRTQQELFT